MSDTSFNYTGALNFNSPPGANTVGGFLGTGGGAITGLTSAASNAQLSDGSFDHVSLFSFTFTTGNHGLNNVSITHDDGISLYLGDNSVTSTAARLVDASAPTSAETTLVPNLAANTTYTLWYVEANGLPAQLTVNATVPEPASMALLGVGLAGIGLIRRRRA